MIIFTAPAAGVPTQSNREKQKRFFICMRKMFVVIMLSLIISRYKEEIHKKVAEAIINIIMALDKERIDLLKR